MRPTLLIAAVGMLYTMTVHAVAGGRRVAAPLRASSLDPFPRAVLVVTWHAVTWWFLTIVGAMVAAAARPSLRVLVPLAALQILGIAVAFVIVAGRSLGASIRLPQWLLLAPLALITGCSVLARSSATATVVLLGALAVVHLAWAAGVTWPARDRAQLAQHVIGSNQLPGRGACVAVGAAFAAFGWLFLAEASRGSWRGRGQLAVAAVFAARGVLGFGFEYARPAIRGTAFATYNRWFYSPLCVLIAALAACSVA